ncbi:hypothetical protein LO763_22230 [Glycomyces sp. A-F 0318]|uniref:hypothetical protein n=1 Tax=Glycomyces amatae TaxID=2881355 RepID=UPI001E5CD3D6|nr:hypothetical protein [Glycomyces amatae]MCD0446336.1 hypothetical protein [Glycomyces amatae]
MISLDDVGNLLRLLAHIDARTVDRDDLKLWLAALQRDRVTFDEAHEAIIEQVTVEPNVRVNVGHVVSRVRDRRRLRRRPSGAGMALQDALRAVPADAPDYQARVIALLRHPGPPPARAAARAPVVRTGPEAAAARAHRGRALVDAALAEHRKAATANTTDAPSRHQHARQTTAAQHRMQQAYSGDPQPLTRTVAKAAALLQARRLRTPDETTDAAAVHTTATAS